MVDVDQTVGAGTNRLKRLGDGADVKDRQLAVTVGGGDDARQGGGGEGGDGPTDRPAAFIDDLDEVGAFGHPFCDERLGLFRVVQGRQRHAELRAVTALHRDWAAREDISPFGGSALGLLAAPLAGHVGVGRHVEDGRDAEVQRLLERRSEVVRVAVDQPRQESHALSLDDLGLVAGARRNVGARRDRLDRAATDHDSGAIEHLVSGEHAGALDHRRRGLGVEGGAERREDGE